MNETLKYLIGVIVTSGLLTPLLMWALDKRQRRAQVRQTGAQTEMTVAQAAQVLNQTAVDWINELNTRVEKLTTQVTNLESETESLEEQLRSSRDMSTKLRNSLQLCLDLLAENNIPRPRLPID